MVEQRDTTAGGHMIEFFPHRRAASPFSRAVRVGDVYYLSGQIGMGPDGKMPEGIEAQARQTMENIAEVLHSLGTDIRAVFKCTVMLRDMSQWRDFNAVYLTYFDPERLPARSAFGASGLAAGALLELECCAYVRQE